MCQYSVVMNIGYYEMQNGELMESKIVLMGVGLLSFCVRLGVPSGCAIITALVHLICCRMYNLCLLRAEDIVKLHPHLEWSSTSSPCEYGCDADCKLLEPCLVKKDSVGTDVLNML